MQIRYNSIYLQGRSRLCHLFVGFAGTLVVYIWLFVLLVAGFLLLLSFVSQSASVKVLDTLISAHHSDLAQRYCFSVGFDMIR